MTLREALPEVAAPPRTTLDPVTDPVTRTLIAARELLSRPWGWTQGTMIEYWPEVNRTSYCLLGAVSYSAPHREIQELAVQAVAKEIGPGQGWWGGSLIDRFLWLFARRNKSANIAAFNDTRSSLDQVVEVLDRAIAKRS